MGGNTVTYDKDSFLAGLSVGMSLRYSMRKDCLTFLSLLPFTLSVYNSAKNWDGTLESSTDKRSWTVWDGTTTLSAAAFRGTYYLYLRGTGNTIITGNSSSCRWVLGGNDISCNGDIRNLLDYSDPENTVMEDHCFHYLFLNCVALISAPKLPATTLKESCYGSMFNGCTSLVVAPELPATTLARQCYATMFRNCTSLINAPTIKAETLATGCCSSMFYGCASLVDAPSLSAVTLANACYLQMFYGCISLVNAPTLSATTLYNNCYSDMFRDCTSLVEPPSLPATTLADYCYSQMFYGCTSLNKLPELPATSIQDYSYQSMFVGCTNIKLSKTQTGEYQTPYSIPYSGTGTIGTSSLSGMFYNTGGTFKSTPAINTTYYTSNTVIP